MSTLEQDFFFLPFVAAIKEQDYDAAEDIAIKAGNILAARVLKQRHTWAYGLDDFAKELPYCLRMQANIKRII